MPHTGSGGNPTGTGGTGSGTGGGGTGGGGSGGGTYTSAQGGLSMQSASFGNTSSGAKVHTPAVFTGTKTRTKEFLVQCRLYFAARPNDFPDDEARIAFALSHCQGGTAGPWAADYFDTVYDKPNATYNWDIFKKAFEEYFSDTLEAESARSQLQRLRQGKSSVQEYVTAFNTFKNNSKYDDTTLIERFSQGLNYEIMKHILVQAQPPKKLQDWQELAVKLDNYNTQAQNARRGGSNFVYPNQILDDKGTKDSTTSRSVRATQIVANAFQRARRNPISKEEQERRRANNLCYQCGSANHIARYCPQRTAARQGQQRQGFQARVVDTTPTTSNSTTEDPVDTVVSLLDQMNDNQVARARGLLCAALQVDNDPQDFA